MMHVSILILLAVVEASHFEESVDTVPAASECELSLLQTELRLTKGKDRMEHLEGKVHSAVVETLEGVSPGHRKAAEKDSHIAAAHATASIQTVDATGTVEASRPTTQAQSSGAARMLAWLQIELRDSNSASAITWIIILLFVGVCLCTMLTLGMKGQDSNTNDKGWPQVDTRIPGASRAGPYDGRTPLGSSMTTPGGGSRLPTGQSLHAGLTQQRTPLVSSLALPPGASMVQGLQQEAPKPGDIRELPPICPSLILPHTEARFMIQMEHLQRAVPGPLNILGTSGRKLLHALVCDTPDSRRCLMLASCGCEDDPRTCIFTPQSGSIDTQALEVFGKAGKFYGWLEFPGGSQALLSHTGASGEAMPVLQIEMGSNSDLRMSASTMDGRLLASAGRGAAGGGDTWKMQVKPGTDAVLITSCMLALILLRPWPSGDGRMSLGVATTGASTPSLRQYPSPTPPSVLSSFFKS